MKKHTQNIQCAQKYTKCAQISPACAGLIWGRQRFWLIFVHFSEKSCKLWILWFSQNSVRAKSQPMLGSGKQCWCETTYAKFVNVTKTPIYLRWKTQNFVKKCVFLKSNWKFVHFCNFPRFNPGVVGRAKMKLFKK